MAEMGSRSLKSNPLVLGMEIGTYPGPIVVGTVVGTAICAPANPVSMSPIMPEGFVTYTGINPTLRIYP
jgi:hypothetical protein